MMREGELALHAHLEPFRIKREGEHAQTAQLEPSRTQRERQHAMAAHRIQSHKTLGLHILHNAVSKFL